MPTDITVLLLTLKFDRKKSNLICTSKQDMIRLIYNSLRACYVWYVL